MIVKAEIIQQPVSGQYSERIYDIASPWNSQNWTFIKFQDKDLNEWCGSFRGAAKAVALSKKYNSILVLTSDYLYQLDCLTGELCNYESQPQYQTLTVTPAGDFIIADDYTIKKIESSIKDCKPLESPLRMDSIQFHEWKNNKLKITCEEFLNWNNTVTLELDGDTCRIIYKESFE